MIVQSQYTRPEEVVDHIEDLLNFAAGTLGLETVAAYDKRLLGKYPAVVIVPGTTQKTYHATHTFNLTFVIALYVYHAKMTESYRTRSQVDLELATAIISVLEADKTFGQKLVQGWVESDTPGVMQPSVDKDVLVVGTRLNWSGISQERF